MNSEGMPSELWTDTPAPSEPSDMPVQSMVERRSLKMIDPDFKTRR
jgi:hypothetical protein